MKIVIGQKKHDEGYLPFLGIKTTLAFLRTAPACNLAGN